MQFIRKAFLINIRKLTPTYATLELALITDKIENLIRKCSKIFSTLEIKKKSGNRKLDALGKKGSMYIFYTQILFHVYLARILNAYSMSEYSL